MLQIMVLLVDQGDAVLGNAIIVVLHLEHILQMGHLQLGVQLLKLDVVGVEHDHAHHVHQGADDEDFSGKPAAERGVLGDIAQVAGHKDRQTQGRPRRRIPAR